MKIVLLDALTLGNTDINELKKLGDFTSYENTQYDEIPSRLTDAQIAITNKVPFDKNTLDAIPSIKLIAISATGTNIIDMEYAKKKGILVKNVAGYSTRSVAQHTLTMALNFLSRIQDYDAYCKSGDWVRSPIYTHLAGGLADIHGKSWGILGLGNIGKEVAKYAKSLGANVSYTSVSGIKQEVEYSIKDLPTLLKTSDIISIHSPLTPKTHNLIDASLLSLLKPGAILLNAGRGGIVNEIDCAKALQTQDFYYGTDVLEKEPMTPNHPFLDPKISHKLLLTPHVAWAYTNSRKLLIQGVVKNIQEFIQKGI